MATKFCIIFIVISTKNPLLKQPIPKIILKEDIEPVIVAVV